jgi:glycosyltransferase involved in cell wall biosynthesis
MRIVIVSETLGNAFGQERVLSLSSKGLKDAEQEVFWIGARSTSESQEFPALLLPDLFASTPSVKKELSSFKAHLEKIKPDIIHWIDIPSPSALALSSKIAPNILTAHTLASTCPASGRSITPYGMCTKKSGFACTLHHFSQGCLSHFKSPLHRFHAVTEYVMKKRALHKLAKIITVNRGQEKLLWSEGWKPSQTGFIPNPVEIEKGVVPGPVEKNPVFVMASRLVKQKGIDLALQALSLIKDLGWNLWIVGDGPELGALKNLTSELEIENRVTFLGRLSTVETQRRIASATCLIASSRGPETFGLAAAEASLLGIPVVAFDIPALNETVLAGQTGLLVPLGNVEKFKDALSQILHWSEDQRNSFGQRGQIHIHNSYSLQKHIDKTLDIYREVTSAL